jgi:hypothetical protein
MKTFGALLTAIAGITFFFAILGVFGLQSAIASLALFVTIAVWVARRVHQ